MLINGEFWLTCWLFLFHITNDSIWTTWWYDLMETLSALLALCAGNSPVPGEFLAQRPVTRSSDIFYDLRLIKRLSKQYWSWWFETPSRPLWRHSNELHTDKVAICDCHNLWPCRVSQFMTQSVAICDNVKICILTTHIYSISKNILFIRLPYTNVRLIYRICLVTATLTYFLQELFRYSNNAVMAQKLKGAEWCQKFTTMLS